MTITKTPLKPLDLVQIDTIGPIPKSHNGFQYAVTLIDELTKFLEIIPIVDKSAKTVATAIFENFVLRYGPLRGIKTDLGTEYVNELIRVITSLLKIEHAKSTAYHHETMGAVERSHRILNEYIRAYLNGNMAEWDVYARYFQFCYNTTPNALSNYRFSPFELLYGRKPNLPNDLLDGGVDPIYNADNYAKELKYRLQRAHFETRSIIDKIKIKNKANYDKNTNAVNFKIGDKVKIKNEPYNKMKYIYSGPFEIIDIIDKNISLDVNGKKYTVHANRLAKY